ncbi:MAG: DUF427 domain-containing protein [Gammaproteobacteria bacterium]|nr:DUF427 domain-containing protein [Gammaproteobacteria bacterium]MDH5730379.1 DUF427 domain-containing protein [Gammaproteobacteria bacterium]
MRAVWKGVELANSAYTIVLEGNHYFPPESVEKAFLKLSQLHSLCVWKGEASYYNIEVEGEALENAAWFYPAPKPEAENIKNYIAFWGDIEVLR